MKRRNLKGAFTRYKRAERRIDGVWHERQWIMMNPKPQSIIISHFMLSIFITQLTSSIYLSSLPWTSWVTWPTVLIKKCWSSVWNVPLDIVDYIVVNGFINCHSSDWVGRLAVVLWEEIWSWTSDWPEAVGIAICKFEYFYQPMTSIFFNISSFSRRTSRKRSLLVDTIDF